MKFTNEQLAKAKAAQSADEILGLAKAEGIEMTEEEARTAFAKTHEPPFGELSEDELKNVAGGANCPETKKVFFNSYCGGWICAKCKSDGVIKNYKKFCKICGTEGSCATCDSYEAKSQTSGICKAPS